MSAQDVLVARSDVARLRTLLGARESTFHAHCGNIVDVI